MPIKIDDSFLSLELDFNNYVYYNVDEKIKTYKLTNRTRNGGQLHTIMKTNIIKKFKIIKRFVRIKKFEIIKKSINILIRMLWLLAFFELAVDVANYFVSIQNDFADNLFAHILCVISYMGYVLSLNFVMVLCGAYSKFTKKLCIPFIVLIKILLPLSTFTFLILKRFFM